jgi:hypothetical protein
VSREISFSGEDVSFADAFVLEISLKVLSLERMS